MTELNLKECVQVSQMGRKEKGFPSRRHSRCKYTGGETAQGVFQELVHTKAAPGLSHCHLSGGVLRWPPNWSTCFCLAEWSLENLDLTVPLCSKSLQESKSQNPCSALQLYKMSAPPPRLSLPTATFLPFISCCSVPCCFFQFCHEGPPCSSSQNKVSVLSPLSLRICIPSVPHPTPTDTRLALWFSSGVCSVIPLPGHPVSKSSSLSLQPSQCSPQCSCTPFLALFSSMAHQLFPQVVPIWLACCFFVFPYQNVNSLRVGTLSL